MKRILESFKFRFFVITVFSFLQEKKYKKHVYLIFTFVVFTLDFAFSFLLQNVLRIPNKLQL